MRTITPDELRTILEKHMAWRRGEEGGARADLAGADLTRAYLADANLADADLAGAYLAGADLAGAYLAGAKNLPSGIAAVDPPEPYSRSTSAAEHAQRYRARHPEVPVVEDLDKKILEMVTVGGGTLEMESWHRCETTHCRAGWAITLAGPAGHQLELQHGPQRAGAMIYRASTGTVPHFFASNEDALEDLRRCAGVGAGGETR